MSESKTGRLVSLDAYRGLIMLTLAAGGFGLLAYSKSVLADNPDNGFWKFIAFQADHTDWISNVRRFGVSYWDLIQPSFMFMVGVAMPFSYAKRYNRGDSWAKMFLHACFRAVALILLGVFLTSHGEKHTEWQFMNVLSQIGLGYVFAFLLLGRPVAVQMLAFIAIVVGYWYWFVHTPVPGAQTYIDHFARNTNAGAQFDKWLLNRFPRTEPFEYNRGGYVTTNFIPSIATMLLGIMAGELLQGDHRERSKLVILFLGGALLMGLGVAASETVCPIVKKIWTPSWVLFSGAYTLWILGLFYTVVDVAGWRRLVFPLVVLGVNSILLYMMGQLMRPWVASQLKTHFDAPYRQMRDWLSAHGWVDLAPTLFAGPSGPIVQATAVMAVFWLICLWLYRQRLFVRI